MPLYLSKGKYGPEGVKGLLKDSATARRDALAKMCEAMGGKLIAIYYALGETDLYTIFECPDNVAVVAGSLIVNAAGTATAEHIPLLTPEEMDESVAIAKKMMAAYRPPGA